MGSQKYKYISPIAIDLGAKNTGVYFAHYKAGSGIDDIEKAGTVYQLVKDGYTLLMAERTAVRHQRRGYARRKMVKRLFRLIWCKYFQLPWDKDVQQTTSFLLNRRGFSFLTEEYDAGELSTFPEEVYNELPEELQSDVKCDGSTYDFASAITDWSQQGEKKVEELLETINKEPKHISQRQVFIKRTEKLREYCEKRINNENIQEAEKAKIKLSNLSKWIVEEWIKIGYERAGSG